MSTSIEQRVVQMKFDNKQFESGVSQTMSTLENLESKLKFKDAAKGFNDISRAAESVSLQGLVTQTETLGGKFDALAVVAISALNRITNEAISAGTNLVKSLSIDQVASGWSKYEAKTAAVQTLVNATGKSVQEIERYMDKLMLYSDETSYGFADMTTALGSMVSAGGDIEKLIPMLEGFGNAISFVGKGSKEFTWAVRQLSQAYGAGYMQLMDWRPIETQMQGAKQLKEVFIQVAEEQGKIAKGSINAGTFLNSLSDKWLDQGVMEEGLGRWAAITEEAFKMVEEGVAETVTDAYEILSESYDNYAMKAALAAQQAKSFTEAIDATKDAVSTKWMESFAIIFGNYEEATELWSELTNTLWDLFAASGDTRNEILSIWKALGGRDEMILAVKAAFEALYKPVEAVKNAIQEIFFPGNELDKGSWLYNATVAVKEFFQSLILSDEACYTLKMAFKALLLPVHAVVEVVKIGFTVFTGLIRIFATLANTILSLPSRLDLVEEAFRKLLGNERYERLAGALTTIFEKLSRVFGTIKERIFGVGNSFRSAFSTSLMNMLTKIGDALSGIGGWIIDRVIDGLDLLASFDYSAIATVANMAFAALSKGFEIIRDKCMIAVNAVRGFVSTLSAMNLSQIISKIISSVKAFGLAIVGFVSNLNVETQIQSITDFIKGLANAIWGLMQKLTPAKILVFAFGVSLIWLFVQLSGAISSFARVADSLTGTLKGIRGFFNALRNRINGRPILQVAVAIGVLAVALGALSMIDGDRLIKTSIALGGLMIAMGLLVAGMAAVNKLSAGSERLVNQLIQIGTAMVTMSVGVALLSASLMMLSNIDVASVVGGLISIAVMMGMIIGAMALLSKIDKMTITNALYIVAFAKALNLMVNALAALNGVEISVSIKNLAALAVIIGLMIGVAQMSKGIKATSGIGMLTMVAMILIFAKVIKPLANMDFGTIIEALVKVVTMMGLLRLAVSIAGDGAEIQKAGAGLAAMAAGLMLLYFAVKSIGQLDAAVVVKGTISVGALMVLFGAMNALSKLGGDGSKALTLKASFLAMAAAILVLGVAIKYIGSLELRAVIQGTVVVSALLIFLSQLAEATGTINKATGTIVAMTICIGLISAAIALFTLLDPKELLVSAAAMSIAFIGMGVMFKAINGIKVTSVISSMIYMVAALATIGILFVELDKLEDPDGLFSKAAAVGVVLVSLGVSLSAITHGKNLNLTNISSIGKTLLIMTGAVVLVGALLSAIDRFVSNPDSILIKTAALSVIFVSLSAAMRILHVKTATLKNGQKTMLMMLEFAAVAGIVLIAISHWADSNGIIEKAIGLGIVLTSLATAMRILPTLSKTVDVGTISKTIGIVGALAGLTTIIFGLFSAVTDAEGIIQKAAAFGIALSIMTAVIGAISLMSGVLSGLGAAAGPAIVGAAAAMAIIAVMGIIVALIGALFDNVEFMRNGLESAQVILPMIGNAIGSFFGSIIGGGLYQAGIAVCALIERFGTSLSNFAENVQGFMQMNINEEAVNSMGRLAAALLLITNAELLDGIRQFFGGDNSLVEFGQQLTEFGPYFAKFSDQIGGINSEAVTAAAACMESLASILATVPTEGGMWGAIFGNKNLESFGSGLGTLAQGIVDYADVLKGGDIDQALVDKTNVITKSLIELANGVPNTGIISTLFSEHDIGKFGEQLSSYGESFVKFYTSIKYLDIDENQVNTVKIVGDMFAELASSIPNTGIIANWFLGKDLGKFGEQLEAFGTSFVKFYATIRFLDIKQEKVDAVKMAGDTLVALAETIPNTGALVTFISGKDIGKFGEQISLFGQGIADFFGAISDAGLDEAKVSLAESAGSAFVRIANELEPNFGVATWWESSSLEEFGKQIKKLGEGVAGFYENTSNVNWPNVAMAVDSIERIVGLAPIMSTLNETAVANFKTFINSLAGVSVDSFTTSFRSSQSDITAAVYQTLNSAMITVKSLLKQDPTSYAFIVQAITTGIAESEDSVVGKAVAICQSFTDTAIAESYRFEEAGGLMVLSLVSGIQSKTPDFQTAIDEVINYAIDSTSNILEITGDYSQKFHGFGEYSVAGYIQGITAGEQEAYSTMVSFANGLVESFENTLEINSPSLRFEDAGMYTVLGFIKGVDENTSAAVQTMVKMGQSLLNSMLGFWGINSPSTVARDEVGRYIVRGIADGITSDMSAEDAAAKKAQNIISAFQSEFDKWSLNASTADLELQLWEALNPNASESELAVKKKETLDKKLQYQAERVNAANAQYQATLEALGENAAETQKAYNTYLQEQITMASLAKEMMDAQGQANVELYGVDERRQIMEDYATLFKEYKEKQAQLGKTEAELAEMAAENSGYKDMVDYIRNNKSGAQSTLGGIIDQYMSSATGTVEGLVGNVQVVLDQSATTAAASGRGAGGSYGSGVAAGIGASIPQVQEEITKMFEDSTDIDFSQYTDAPLDFIDKIRKGIGDFGGEARGLLKDNILNPIVDFFKLDSPNDNVMAESGELIAGSLAIGITAGTQGAVAESVEGTANVVVEAVADVPNEWTTIGNNMALGMANGITENERFVVDAAKQVAMAAKAATMGMLDMHSPSKVYHKIGEYIDQGLANGVIDKTAIVEGAVKDMLKTIQKPVNKAVSGIRSVTYELDPGDYSQLLRWDAAGNLIPATMANWYGSLPGQEDARWWIAPDLETAEAIRRAADSIEAQQAYEQANKGRYEGTVEDLEQAIRDLAEKPREPSIVQNNYSPEALPSSVIYRNTKSAIAAASASASPTGQSFKSSGTGNVYA